MLQPHLRQRPVLLSAVASHSGQALHVASRVASASGGVVGAPWRKKLKAEFLNWKIRSMPSRSPNRFTKFARNLSKSVMALLKLLMSNRSKLRH